MENHPLLDPASSGSEGNSPSSLKMSKLSADQKADDEVSTVSSESAEEAYDRMKDVLEEADALPTERRKKRNKPKRAAKPSYDVGITFVDSNSRQRVPLSSAEVSSDRRNRIITNPRHDVRDSETELMAPPWKARKPKRHRSRRSQRDRSELRSDGEPEVSGDESSEGEELPEDEELKCAVARTAIVINVDFKNEIAKKINPVDALLQRHISVAGRQQPLWKMMTDLPPEVADLTPHFQSLFGGFKNVNTSQGTWNCTRLCINPVVLEELFSTARLVTGVVPRGSTAEYIHAAAFTEIEFLLYPLGTAFLVFHIDWKPQESQEVTLRQARTLLYAAKYRYAVPDVSYGWNFSSSKHSFFAKESLGDRLHAAKFSDDTISINCLVDWLVALPGESPSDPPTRHDNARHSYHHSCIVLDKQPSRETLRDYLFHLMRAFGQKNRPPPEEKGFEANNPKRVGKRLVWRLNRYVGVSREGTVSISWPIQADDLFELHRWHKKFLGIYFLLAEHVYGEKMVLLELSSIASAQADALRISAEMNVPSAQIAKIFEETKAMRSKLRDLATSMVRYTLSLSSNDCGGVSEYVEFFRTMRDVLGIEELRSELSNELRDVLALVESFYLEEDKRRHDAIEAQNRAREQKEREVEKEQKARDQRMEILGSIAGSFTLPFVIVSGVFGMNLDNLPTQVPFWELMAITLGVSLCILLMFLLIRTHGPFSFKRKGKKDEKKEQRNSEGDLHEIVPDEEKDDFQ
eukprot:TRINITY_DN3369_c0_g1_i1.p1 TRINITY_DN3369_c0_g1~~TRINITY_DN3369_c0_g1_i1.p1  ORF type:complete len:748 (-),score=166.42 TRINITY_DN3369_c0_g1_i1:87-2330(-)